MTYGADYEWFLKNQLYAIIVGSAERFQFFSFFHIFSKCIQALLPADASDFILQSALNDLWSLKPDTVQVTRTQNPQSYVYMVTFISTRGKHIFHFAGL